MSWIETLWYKKGIWSWFLLPLTLLFYLLSRLRILLYRKQLLKSFNVSVPVIVVGNISVGGSGKTPLVLYLVRELQIRGFRPGIISRGYRGKSDRWPQDVHPESAPNLVGDEPLLMARRSGVPVVVDPNRVKAAEYLLSKHPVDVIISDDGLQHYRLRRDIEIAVVDGDRRFGNGRLLPAGPLREPLSRLRQVDFIVCNGGSPALGEQSMSLKWQMLQNLKSGTEISLESLKGVAVHAIAGIGNPQRFFKLLESVGLAPIPHPYPDHHDYRVEDICFDDQRPVIMTEKDAVKCQSFATDRHWMLAVDAQLNDRFIEEISHHLERLRG